jgi:hypothetical protein
MAMAPVEVIECQGCDFPRAKAQSHEQQQDRSVSPAEGRGFVAATKDILSLLGCQVAWQ